MVYRLHRYIHVTYFMSAPSQNLAGIQYDELLRGHYNAFMARVRLQLLNMS